LSCGDPHPSAFAPARRILVLPDESLSMEARLKSIFGWTGGKAS
jgi:hypothetical protein